MRVGFGNDIHRLEEGRKLFVGGVLLPHTKGAVAHSDGDVLIHALIDAILGALSKGDIGTFFPPEDKKYKDIDSKLLLGEILKITNPEFVNIDAVITLEGFKLLPYKNQIRESIAELCKIDVDRVSVKAKTNEGLDALGKGEAIKAEVILLLNN
ncbi:MAG: 2-C-methyl-D-erythritol 2,4-cyclodiphosphate synthase [Spirochaetales bacterium]|nr:2-C-methyl-D-erythritol 2,4-cyclodiphosphate synthase [Spirochaetales bacterium]